MTTEDLKASAPADWLTVDVIPRRDGRPGYELVIGFKGEVSTETTRRANVEIQWRGTRVEALIMPSQIAAGPNVIVVDDELRDAIERGAGR